MVTVYCNLLDVNTRVANTVKFKGINKTSPVTYCAIHVLCLVRYSLLWYVVSCNSQWRKLTVLSVWFEVMSQGCTVQEHTYWWCVVVVGHERECVLWSTGRLLVRFLQ